MEGGKGVAKTGETERQRDRETQTQRQTQTQTQRHNRTQVIQITKDQQTRGQPVRLSLVVDELNQFLFAWMSVQTLCKSWKMILCVHIRCLHRKGRYRSRLQVPNLMRSGTWPLSMISVHASSCSSCEGPAACAGLGTISPAKSPIWAH